MDKIKTTEGDRIIRDARFAIVASRFNDFIVESLIRGSLHCLRQHGAADADIEIVRVPGAFEMPVVVDKIAAVQTGNRGGHQDVPVEAVTIDAVVIAD